MRRGWLLAVALSVVFFVAAGTETKSAETAKSETKWPTRPIRIIVPFAAGGSTDVTARVVAQALSERLGQQVFVENRPGAGGNIGAEAVAKADPDGYTLLLTTNGTLAVNPSLYKTLAFDVKKDFAPIALTARIPNVLVVNPSVPGNNVADFIAYAKANPGKLNFGSSGNGTSPHIAGELFNVLAGVNMTHVPYRGGAVALTDLLGGQIQVMFEPLAEVIQQVRAETVKALGVTTVKRSSLLPDVPTIAETLPGYEITAWNGMLAPAATPPDIIARLNRATDDALHSKEVQEKLAEQGSEPVGGTPAEFDAFLDSELIKWKKLVEISGATVQ
ncbi:tripartite tricarboxylate transporter substrate binding protein [Bradyrhizobium sp. dw_78]|uniref:tripartite tricarboxylate transporter substrate binding protein n=1 Tax=Bradyrhizobium sp. dw_78 TaxID=2719793 RepID=UPI001BD63D63|nr:tripartite tricarboxylate transporter substrate binding protein [Bradyrhizobium sp. dw_78]